MYWDKDAVDEKDYGACNQGMVPQLVRVYFRNDPCEEKINEYAHPLLQIVPSKKFGCIFGRRRDEESV
jgi:hypothetical protein